MSDYLKEPQPKAEQVKFTLSQEANKSYNSHDFDEANTIMAELIKNTLGDEAANSLGLLEATQREKLKAIFYDAALQILNEFRSSFNEEGDYLSEREKNFWAACDQEGPIAKKLLKQALEVVGLDNSTPEHIDNTLNNVYVEDALKLTLKTLKLNGIINDAQCSEIEQDLLNICKDSKQTREVFSKVVPTSDYYYGRINREEKINDESILKFNNGESHNDVDLKTIDLALRLANATWLAAQRHCAKKDGKTDRIEPNKRGGVFNTPDNRHMQQFKEAITSGLNNSEAVMRIVFELCKDSWMLED